MKIIDIHCHMFNLKYLPVAGILRRYSNNYIPHLAAVGIEWLLIKNTKSNYDKKSILEHKRTLPDEFNIPAYQYLGLNEFKYTIKETIKFNPPEAIEAILKMPTVGDLLESPLSTALDQFINESKGSIKNLEVNEPLTLETLNLKEKVQDLYNWLKKLLNKIADLYEQIKNYLKWFVFMTHSEEDIYAIITTKDSQNTDLFLHLMMDVDYFLNDSDNINELDYTSYFDFVAEQIPNMQQLNKDHKDNLVGFVAFNPARPNCMKIIKDAVEKYGFKGVKFYPPLGYKAYGDKKYKKQIEELFNYCCTNNIPLFTHCNNQGFEAWPSENSGYKSNPVFWEMALKEFPKLKLCLGHAGGVEGWFTKNVDSDITNPDEIMACKISNSSKKQKDWNKSYSAMVFKLCCKYENVYCDASYLDEMINSDGTFNMDDKTNFKSRLLKLFHAQPVFAKKIMYGSDWHMLFQEGKNGVYLNSYIDFFKDSEFDNYRDNFFYLNAKTFLNL